MKNKNILMLLLFAVIACGLIFVIKNSSNIELPDDLILNYSDYSPSIIEKLELKDYTVENKDGKRLVATRNKDNKTFVIAENAFNLDKKLVFIITGKDNTIYYVAMNNDEVFGSVRQCDLDTMKFTKLSGNGHTTNYSAFLDIGQILGIKPVNNNSLSLVSFGGRYIICSSGVYTYREMSELIGKYDTGNDYFVQDNIEKMGYRSGKVYFINEMNELISFDINKKEFERVTDTKVSDFIVSSDNLIVFDLAGNKMVKGKNDC